MTIVKGNDKKNGVSIGVVPYAAQVNVPANLRAQFNVPEPVALGRRRERRAFPTSTALNSRPAASTRPHFPRRRQSGWQRSRTATLTSTTTTNYEAPLGPVATSRACTTNAETASTTWIDADVNKVLLPTKNAQPVIDKVSRLTAAGNTYSVVGMRWGTALMDEAARPIYTNLLSAEPGMAGRPADNNSIQTRKIIILMTDGDHVTNNHIVDAFKSGPSPIWRGTDGNYAIRYTSGGQALTGGTRPATCSGWPIASARQYFVPHLKDDSERARGVSTELEGRGTGTLDDRSLRPERVVCCAHLAANNQRT